MEQYCIYLRKSRKDREAELLGEGETLARHEKTLLQLAQKMELNIGAIYREIVSGETISSRPEMQRLLHEIEDRRWAGVLVMEVERLARGDTKDQGIVAETFKYGNAKIITPVKVYDPENEFDEEYFEFGLFMSRREYKTITRRIQRGRIASVNEGKYISPTPPYGYDRVKITNDKGYTLRPNPTEAPVVQMIFTWYVHGRENPDGNHEELGMYRICGLLDERGIKPRRRSSWSRHTIKDILSNITYTGKICWQWRAENIALKDGVRVKSRKKAKDGDYMCPDGLHPAIVPMELFQAAQDKMASYTQPPLPGEKELKNPLAGLLKCRKCGRAMMRIPASGRNCESIRCPERACSNISAPLLLVEQELLYVLEEWLIRYKLSLQAAKPYDSDTQELAMNHASYNAVLAELQSLEEQNQRIYDFLEKGVYTTEIFLERSRRVKTQRDELLHKKEFLEKKILKKQSAEQAEKQIIPKIEHVLDVYWTTESIVQKNQLLREVLEKVEYQKDIRNKKGEREKASFELFLYPKLPDESGL